MLNLKSISALLVLPLLLALVFADESAQRRKRATKLRKTVVTKTARVPVGMWGAERANLNVTEKGAAIDFDCALGEIKEPLILDSNNCFSATGTYRRERPGPVREGEDTSRPARYSGHLNGKTLTLTIKLEDGEQTTWSLVFTFGKFTHLARCQ